MNTIIIDKILIHTLDMEHGKIIYSDTFINLDEEGISYYDKKVEKVLESSTMKQVIVGEQHFLLNVAKEMIQGNEEFKEESTKIIKDFYNLCKNIDKCPDSDVMFVECKIDGKKKILIIKINHKLVTDSTVEENGDNKTVKFINTQRLPAKGAAIEEAIIIDIEENTIQLIEKKFMIDGKSAFYLNEHYIKGEPTLTDKQKFDILKKVLHKVNNEFNVMEQDILPAIKQTVVESIMDHKTIKPIEIARTLLKDDYNATEEAELFLNDLGIEEEDTISNISSSIDILEKCKIILDEDRVVEMNVSDYVNGSDFVIVNNSDGTISLTLNNIRDIKIK